MTRTELLERLQYTNVRADATEAEIREHCETAARYGFQAVMVQPCWVKLARGLLHGTGVLVATAIAYPLGGETTGMKVGLAQQAVGLGADELDFQPNIGFLLSGMLREFSDEIRAVVSAAEGRPVKAMLEFGFLAELERARAVALAEEAGVAYVKNSSGVGPGGSPATPEAIRFIRQHLTGRARIKASGRIRSYADAVALIEAGAHLIGSSVAPAIADGGSASACSY